MLSSRSASLLQRSSGVSRPQPRLARRLVIRAAQVSSNDLKNGLTIQIDGAPYRVLEFLHVKPGKGAAFVRTKMKNVITGGNVDKTFRAGEMIDLAEVSKRDSQFTYMDGDELVGRLQQGNIQLSKQYVFMDLETFEERRMAKDDSWARLMAEGTECALVLYQDRVISVDLPLTMEMEIVETAPGVKGNTASGGGNKAATLATGAEISVPLFINTGDKIKVDTREFKYLGRVNE